MSTVSFIQTTFQDSQEFSDTLMAVKKKFPNHREADSTRPVEAADGTLIKRHVRHILSFSDETGKVIVFANLFFLANVEQNDAHKFIERIEKFEKQPGEVFFIFGSVNKLDPRIFNEFKDYKVIGEKDSIYLLQKKIFVPIAVPAVVPVAVPVPEPIEDVPVEKSSWTARKIAILAVGIGLGAAVVLSILHRLKLPLLLKGEHQVVSLFNRLFAKIS